MVSEQDEQFFTVPPMRISFNRVIFVVRVQSNTATKGFDQFLLTIFYAEHNQFNWIA